MNFNLSFHPLFIILCCAFIYFGYFGLLVSYILCLLLHECAHALVAKRLGYQLNKIKLMPHGVSISGSNVYFSYKDEVRIALAGPLANFMLVVLTMAFWWALPVSYSFTYDFYIANLVIAIVNLLPIYPLDGGRVLLALLSQKFSRMRAVTIVRVIGVILSSLLIVLFVITTFFAPNFTLLFFGVFLFVTSLTDTRNIQYSRVNNLAYKMSRINKGISVRNIAVNQNITLYRLFSQISPFSITNFTVLDNNLKVVGHITEKELNRLVTIYPADAKLTVILHQMLV